MSIFREGSKLTAKGPTPVKEKEEVFKAHKSYLPSQGAEDTTQFVIPNTSLTLSVKKSSKEYINIVLSRGPDKLIRVSMAADPYFIQTILSSKNNPMALAKHFRQHFCEDHTFKMIANLIEKEIEKTPDYTKVTNRILLALDLDDTHFVSYYQKSAKWIGSKEFWVKLYQDLQSNAHKHGFEVIFSVVTNKPEFDDICAEAAKAFKPFLQAGNRGMYQSKGNGEYCLVSQDQKLRYEHLHSDMSFDHGNIPGEPKFSHFIVQSEAAKAPIILNLANQYGIPPNRCILFDDTPSVLEEVSDKGINTVSFSCFNSSSHKSETLENPAYIEKHLSRIRQEILSQVNQMMNCPKKQALSLRRV